MAATGGGAESREAKGDPAHGNWGLRQGWSSDCSGPGTEGKWPGAWKCTAQRSGGSLGGKWATPAHPPFGVPRGRGVRSHRTRQATDGGGKEGGLPTFKGLGFTPGSYPHSSVGAQAPKTPFTGSLTCSHQPSSSA